MVEFEGLGWSHVMGGLARDLSDAISSPAGRTGLIEQWLRVADGTAAPLDPLVWVEAPIRTSYPACMAVEAAAEQGEDAGYRYLRRLREGLLCERRKLDHTVALVEEARAAGLDVERFRLDLHSHAITELFGADLDKAKALGERQGSKGSGTPAAGEPFSRGAGGAPLPTLVFRGDEGEERVVVGHGSYERYQDAAVVVGARPSGEQPSVEALIARFGRVTSAEVELVCELPGPRAGAELFRLAEQWKVRPVRKLTGYLWEVG
jgi:protein-disulfide isomerase-like protein with CxxC motif